MIKKFYYLILNLLWVSSYFIEYLQFRRYLGRVDRVQRKLLLKILRKNRNCKFGRAHQFSSIRDISDFKSKVGLSSYQDYAPFIKSILKGEQKVLTAEKVILCVPSSGSTAASKYIPYTQSLLTEFKRGLYPWIFDLFSQRKKLLLGKCYWSISPVTSSKSVSAPEKVGFNDDSEYFGRAARFLIKSLAVVPFEVTQIEDIEAFRYLTLLFLLRERDLAFISIWNPSFLTLILDSFQKYADYLLRDLRYGRISGPVSLSLELKEKLDKKLYPNERRAREIEDILIKQRYLKNDSIYEKIWPNLSLISCWCDGNSKHSLGGLQALFPNVEIQPKGLIATEGMISFPLMGEEAGVLSFRSHFFEFRELKGIEKPKDLKSAHQLEKNKRYSVVVTTGGGLYRYDLADTIEVVGFKKKCPLIRFIEKNDKISDICGEKLNESHVDSLLKEIFNKYEVKPSFYLMAPESGGGRLYYTLFVEFRNNKYLNQFVDKAGDLIYNIEEGLKKNFHYQYCKKLAQLKSLRVFIIKKDAQERYFQHCFQRQILGNMKRYVLSSYIGWSKVFEGYFLKGGAR